MTFADRLRSPGPQPEGARRDRAEHEIADITYQPDGTARVTLPASPQALDAAAQRAAVEQLGVEIPDGWHVRVTQMRYDPAAWHRDEQGQDAVTRPVWRYVLAVEPAPACVLDDLDALLREAMRRKPVKRAAAGDAGAFIAVYADLQIGKVDERGGLDVIVQQIMDKTDAAIEHVRALRRAGVHPSEGLIVFGGDCVEGFVSQGGRLAWRTDATMTQMVRVLRRVAFVVIERWSREFDSLTVAAVPGNHDQAIRQPVTTKADDSWDIDALSAVADALALQPERFGHVRFVFPQDDSLTVTLNVAGTIVAAAHGHQFPRGDALRWWAQQAQGMTAAGDATLLLAGHRHHLRVETAGPRTFIQAPALDPGSAWFRNEYGLSSAAGLLTLTTKDGAWDHLRVH